MDYTPLGVRHLLSSSEVKVEKKSFSFKPKYTVYTKQGEILKIQGRGFKKFLVTDTFNKEIAVFRMHTPCFAMPWMEVRMTPDEGLMMKVRAKGGISRSILILDRHEREILMIRASDTWTLHPKYKILGAGEAEIGSIKKNAWDFEMVYPADLDVRCKASLIAAFVYNNIREEAAERSSNN